MITPWLFSYLLLWILVLGVGFLLLGTLSALGRLQWRFAELEATRPKRTDRDGLQPGTKAPDFTLPNSAGEEISLSDYAGQQVLLVFTQTGCPPCRAMLPELNRQQRKGARQILVVNHGDLEETIETTRVLRTGFPVLCQNSWSISKLYKVYATPFAFVIDEDGVITAKGVVSSRQFLQYFVTEAENCSRLSGAIYDRDSNVERDHVTLPSDKELTHV